MVNHQNEEFDISEIPGRMTCIVPETFVEFSAFIHYRNILTCKTASSSPCGRGIFCAFSAAENSTCKKACPGTKRRLFGVWTTWVASSNKQKPWTTGSVISPVPSDPQPLLSSSPASKYSWSANGERKDNNAVSTEIHSTHTSPPPPKETNCCVGFFSQVVFFLRTNYWS